MGSEARRPGSPAGSGTRLTTIVGRNAGQTPTTALLCRNPQTRHPRHNDRERRPHHPSPPSLSQSTTRPRTPPRQRRRPHRPAPLLCRIPAIAPRTSLDQGSPATRALRPSLSQSTDPPPTPPRQRTPATLPQRLFPATRALRPFPVAIRRPATHTTTTENAGHTARRRFSVAIHNPAKHTTTTDAGHTARRRFLCRMYPATATAAAIAR